MAPNTTAPNATVPPQPWQMSAAYAGPGFVPPAYVHTGAIGGGPTPYASPSPSWPGIRQPVQYRYDPAWTGEAASSLGQRLLSSLRGLALVRRPQLWLSGVLVLVLQAILGLLYLMTVGSPTSEQNLPPTHAQPSSWSATVSHPPTSGGPQNHPAAEPEVDMVLRPFGRGSRGNSNPSNSSSAPRSVPDKREPTLAPPKGSQPEMPPSSERLGATEEKLPWDLLPALPTPATASPDSPSLPDRAALERSTIHQTSVWTNPETDPASLPNATLPAPTSESKARLKGVLLKARGTTP